MSTQDPTRRNNQTRRTKKTHRGSSKWCAFEKSGIHQTGGFAARDIPEGTRVIEYVGEKLKNDEANQRGIELAETAAARGDASVFNFVLDDKHMIDGNREYNLARFLNHSCDPNCYVDVIRKRIWIIALRDIEQGEELTYDYGFEVEHWKEHPCRCGAEFCVGHIVSQEQWPELKKLIKKEARTKRAAKKKQRKRPRISKATASAPSKRFKLASAKKAAKRNKPQASV